MDGAVFGTALWKILKWPEIVGRFYGGSGLEKCSLEKSKE